MQDLEQKRKRIEMVVKTGAALVVGFIVAPFIFVAIKGALGLLAAGIIGVIAINVAPWIGAKAANLRLKAIKHEASKNPIETLQNELKSRMEALARFRGAIEASAASVHSFAGKLEGFKKQFPSDAEKFDEQHAQARAHLETKKQKYKFAMANLKVFEAEIAKADAIWQLALAAADMNKATGVNEQDFFAKIQVETALDSVQKSIGTAFADLELSVLDEGTAAIPAPKVQAALPPPSTEPLTFSSLELREPERAAR